MPTVASGGSSPSSPSPSPAPAAGAAREVISLLARLDQAEAGIADRDERLADLRRRVDALQFDLASRAAAKEIAEKRASLDLEIARFEIRQVQARLSEADYRARLWHGRAIAAERRARAAYRRNRTQAQPQGRPQARGPQGP